MRFPDRAKKQKQQPLTVPLVLVFYGGLLDGGALTIGFSEDQLDRIDGQALKAEFELLTSRYFYQSLVNYTPEIDVYQMNHVRTKRLSKK